MKNMKTSNRSPQRILMIAACPFPWPRGTPIRIQRLAEALVREGNTVDVVTYHLGKSTADLNFPVHRIAKVFYYHRVSPGPSLTKLFLLNPMLLVKLLKIGKNGRYDIIHAHHIEGLMVALIAGKLGLNLPVVYDAHTLVGSELSDYGPQLGSGVKRWIGNILDQHLTRRANSVIAVTDFIKNTFENSGCGCGKTVYLVPNGIEENFIQCAETAKQELSKIDSEAMIETEKKQSPLFMFSGNLAAYQGIDLMLRAFALVVKQFPAAQLKILTNESFENYRSLAESLGIYQKLSVADAELKDLPGILVQADVLLNPRTKCSGIPQKLLNYMAVGRPIVSFADSAKILTNRVHGLIVENGDIEKFAAAMMELVRNRELGEKLSKAALELILAGYSWKSAAQQTLKVYRDTQENYAEK